MTMISSLLVLAALATPSLGVRVGLHGDDFDEARKEKHQNAAKSKFAFARTLAQSDVSDEKSVAGEPGESVAGMATLVGITNMFARFGRRVLGTADEDSVDIAAPAVDRALSGMHELPMEVPNRTFVRVPEPQPGEEPQLPGEGNLTIGGFLGAGAYGQVVVVESADTGHKFALKTIPADEIDNCRREVECQRKVQPNPNAVKIEASYVDEKHRLNLILELCPSGDIIDKIDSRGLYVDPNYTPRGVFQQLVKSLHIMHSKGVVHRDIKPDNIFLDDTKISVGQSVKIGDFGLSRTFTEGLRNLRDPTGTPAYASPELFKTKTSTYEGPEVDVWALGVTLHIFLCGYMPFAGDTKAELTTHIMKNPPFELPSKVSDSARGLVKKMLNKHWRERIRIEEIMEHPYYLDTD